MDTISTSRPTLRNSFFMLRSACRIPVPDGPVNQKHEPAGVFARLWNRPPFPVNVSLHSFESAESSLC